jgi:hypothetical protein
MKSTERHELKKSEMEKFLENAQNFFQVHGTKILGAVVVIAAIFVAFWYINNNAKVARQQALEQLMSIQSGQSANAKPDDLRIIAQETSDDKVAALAWKLYGDALYNQTLTDEKANVQELLNRAEDAYKTVVDQYAGETVVAAGAKLGLAAIYEDQGKWNQAAQIYQQVAGDAQLASTGLPEVAKSKETSLAAVEKSTKMPMPTSQPATTQTKPAATKTTGLAK